MKSRCAPTCSRSRTLAAVRRSRQLSGGQCGTRTGDESAALGAAILARQHRRGVSVVNAGERRPPPSLARSAVADVGAYHSDVIARTARALQIFDPSDGQIRCGTADLIVMGSSFGMGILRVRRIPDGGSGERALPSAPRDPSSRSTAAGSPCAAAACASSP